MSRFFVDPPAIGDNYIYLTDKNDIKHMVKVLRMKKGDSVDISDSVKWEYKAVIESITQEEVVLAIEDKQKFSREPQIEVTLFQGIPKAGKMESIIQKCVELGVYEIVPVFMDRTVVIERDSFSKKIQRWQKISSEAVKQCRRGRIPIVESQTKFNDILEKLADFDLVLFPYENEESYTIKDCLRKKTLNSNENLPGKIAIIIGPEGGFSDYEVGKLDEIGAEKITLGRTILRTETAGMTALAMTMYELEL